MMTNRRKALLMLPYLLLAGIVVYCWVLFIRGIYSPQWQHWAALVLVALNGALYLKRVKQAIIFTGIVLVLATLNLLAFFPAVSSFSIGFGSGEGAIHTPGIQSGSLPLLIIYAIINSNYLADLYIERKEAKAKMKDKGNA